MSDDQISFSNAGFDRYAKTTKRSVFLAEMNRIVPWGRLCKIVEPYYPKAETGRPRIDLEVMVRIHILQQWFDLSDPAAEESLYDIVPMRQFVGIDLGNAPVPDETTICKFRHLLEKHQLGRRLFDEVNAYLRDSGVKVASGTIVDATIIAAPSSTKNKAGERDPEMHQTKKGNQWHFGMKAHIGIDSASKVVHSVVTTAANVHDSRVIADLLHGKETRVWGDSAYLGQHEAIVGKAPQARLFINKRAYRNRPLSDADRATNRRKSRVRSRVEHIFGTIKGVFHFRKVRYRGLAKNTNRIAVLLALANLLTQKKRLLRLSTA
jgi:IS5 family transposase